MLRLMPLEMVHHCDIIIKFFRTENLNSVLALIYQQTNELRNPKKENEESFSTFPASVPRAGIEPAQHRCHWCLRPTRLPIPPSGLNRSTIPWSIASAKVETFFNSKKFFDNFFSSNLFFLEYNYQTLLNILLHFNFTTNDH